MLPGRALLVHTDAPTDSSIPKRKDSSYKKQAYLSTNQINSFLHTEESCNAIWQSSAPRFLRVKEELLFPKQPRRRPSPSQHRWFCVNHTFWAMLGSAEVLLAVEAKSMPHLSSERKHFPKVCLTHCSGCELTAFITPLQHAARIVLWGKPFLSF